MKKVVLIKYNLKSVSINNRTLIHRALYGYIDHSNKGNYTYQRKGVLKELKYKKISDSVLLINREDMSKILPLFKKYKVKVNLLNLLIP